MSDPVYVFSAGLWRLAHEVGLMSGLAPRRAWLTAGSRGAVAGWGHKPTAERARAAAKRRGLPYLAFEDGFLRSVKPGPGQRPISMVMDRSGIYYDARQPSDLERLLREEDFPEAELLLAMDLVAAIRKERLSKYNHANDRLTGQPGRGGRKLVVVLDQTLGDASVECGLADAGSFQRMLQAAVDENPGAAVEAKLHPEVMRGSKQGYLREVAAALGVAILAEDVSPWALLDLGPRVYTVSSQLGFEAVLAGCQVTCFGAPFYAGWGLTDDRVATPRRGRNRSALELAAAVYLRYAFYFDAWRRTPVDAFTAVNQLGFLRRHYHGNQRKVIVYRLPRWKRRAVAAMLDGPSGPVRFTSSLAEAAAVGANGTAAAWGMMAAKVRRRGVPCLAIEDGFIRSAGLGAAFVQPLSLVFDSRGIYYDPSGPSDIEELLQNGVIAPADAERAAKLAARIAAERITKYNLDAPAALPAAPEGTYSVLVPGQVADDWAVLRSAAASAPAGENINATLLAAARDRHPGAFVIFKPHPDVERLGRRGALKKEEELRSADHVARDTPIDGLLNIAHRVETYSSLAGFEALLRGLPVTVHGLPFYCGWGLTEDLVKPPRRGRKRGVDELAAAALICYARYWDPVSGLACPPEVTLDRIVEQRRIGPGFSSRIGGIAGRMVIAWRNAGRRLKVDG